MDFSIEYLLENVIYDMVIDNSITYHGTIDYISDHMADGNVTSLNISANQIPILQKFTNDFLNEKRVDDSITLESFYNNRKAI